MTAIVVFGTSSLTGGVSKSAHLQLAHLQSLGIESVGVHTATAVAQSLRYRNAQHLVNASGARSIRLARALVAARRRVVPYFHGEAAFRMHLRTSSIGWLSAATEVWVTNQQMKVALEERTSVPVLVVAPTLHSQNITVVDWPTEIQSVAITEGRGNPVYGAEFAAEVLFDLNARHGVALESTYISYGWSSPEAPTFSSLPLSRLSRQLIQPGREAFESAIRATSLLLRPTESDGDSISVREALTWGIPVLASDVAPRPKGTFVLPLSVPRWSDALAGVHQPPSSTGDGLGERLDIALSRLVSRLG